MESHTGLRIALLTMNEGWWCGGEGADSTPGKQRGGPKKVLAASEIPFHVVRTAAANREESIIKHIQRFLQWTAGN